MTELIHSGVAHDENPPGRGSGRHPWGSGENPYQHQYDFISEVNRLKKQGLKDSEIAIALLGQKAKGVDLKAELAIAKNITRKDRHYQAVNMLNKYDGNASAAARAMGMSISSFKSLVNPEIAEFQDRYENTARAIQKVVDQKKYVDVGKNVGIYLNVPDNTKDVAIKILEKEGYIKGYVKVPQLGTKHETSVVVLSPPGTTYAEQQANKFNIAPIQVFTPDKGKTFFVPEFPSDLSSKRIMVRYKEEGGEDKDGVIELRRGVEDLSLGDAQYAQVRIAVDGTHYLKGMAMYGDNMPDGVDVIFNTNKKVGTPLIGTDEHNEVLKRLKVNATGEVDKDNPFGALIMAGGQYHYQDAKGKDQLSPINKIREEGEWDSWSRNLASQFLSKQPMKLINQQIDLTLTDRKLELETIMKLTNPIIKQKLLTDFADTCDKRAEELNVKGFKGQAYQVLLPMTSVKDNEIYAPMYKDGDTVALVRYPHGGTFEIPVLKVNNKNDQAKDIMRDAKDAVGISSSTAAQLSGADFDGDTAMVIPLKSNRISVVHQPYPNELKNFNPKDYKLPDSAPEVTNDTKQRNMGIVTNLINDMSVAGAPKEHIVRAVKHSMVVIDSEKHHLDWKQSAKDNDIESLKQLYQEHYDPKTGKMRRGSSTILSQASAEEYVPERKETTDYKNMTPEEQKRWDAGYKVYRPTGRTKMQYVSDPSVMTPEELSRYNAGKKVYRETTELVQEKVSRMSLTDDARSLIRDPNNPKEVAYADYANQLKAMAREARAESRTIKPVPVNVAAKKVYAAEVERLNAAIKTAKANSPRERTAQNIGNARAAEIFKNNPDMDKEHRDRTKAQCINKARAEVGAKKEKIVISDREWEAIQAGAISTEKLRNIIANTDLDALKKRATPKGDNRAITPAQEARIKAMYSSGMYTQKEIAEALGISASSVSSTLKAS